MLDENVLFFDVDPLHWNRLFALFSGQKKTRAPRLFLMVENGICLKAIHTEKGALIGFDYGRGDLAEIARRENVETVAQVGRDFFQHAFFAGQENLELDDDYVLQLMTVFNSVTAYTGENITWYPKRPWPLRALNYEKAQKNIDRFFPDNRTLFFLVLDNGRPYTSLILGKREGRITLITTLEALDAAHSPFDPHLDLLDTMEKIEELFEKVHLSFVIEKRCFEEMLAGTRPLTFLHAARKHGRAILEPVSRRLSFVLWAGRVFKRL